ncbi:RNA polymerase sigma factor [Galbibacter mesophilus]|uniref:RNA polymerase sigma factor n=1 Tax=Galbibacter mesophilus TaxID=379069 RepID=UPI00191DC366|nr:sigma-70 family RNA polymerase sigma factor [Galbibacter mesophilus]MCM5662516.1 sigma-70 family RNA polymerase sigma factor [Galbibacter mesophilus]
MQPCNFELLKKGDPIALARIHAQYGKSIFWIGKRLLDDEFVLETLVQDVFLRLWDCRDTIETPKHIYFFLRFVMKRECNFYYSRPKEKFLRTLNSLESYDNYQDYMVGYDPENDNECIREQEQTQNKFEKIEKVLPLLGENRSYLIELCLKYGFRYKAIASMLGKGTTETRNETARAIEEIKTIIHLGNRSAFEPKNKNGQEKPSIPITELQERILGLRFEKKHSFEHIAKSLGLSQREVQSEFASSYKFWPKYREEQLKSA